MSKNAVTIVSLCNGKEVRLSGTPKEIVKKMTGEDGKLRDELIEFGVFYINPKHVSMLNYEEEETNKDDSYDFIFTSSTF